jgi:pimeloyl-ACP methyl ester carboxylesterase
MSGSAVLVRYTDALNADYLHGSPHQHHKIHITHELASILHQIFKMSNTDIVLPRPGAPLTSSQPPIPGPSESSFTQTFGTLLPPAKYVHTTNGKAAYYDLPPTTTSQQLPDRVLLIHGVQTPALGLLPLARALRASFPHSHFVLFDLWGHGLSDTPFAVHSAGLFHGLIDALLDELAWPSAHLIGFSLGGSLTAGYVASRPSRVQSFTLVAPAGLFSLSGFDAEGQAHLRGGGDETAAKKYVLAFLEDGELVVPENWRERVAKGEIVAEALRQWQMREHKGHGASVVAGVRDGAVMDNDAAFVQAAKTGLPNVVVLGELDDICTKDQLEKLGFKDVNVVLKAGHAVVRERVPEVAEIIERFWRRLEAGGNE